MCLTCAKEPIERESRKDVVRNYAETNWEKLEPAAKKWEAERLNAYANMAAVYQQQGTSYQQQGTSYQQQGTSGSALYRTSSMLTLATRHERR